MIRHLAFVRGIEHLFALRDQLSLSRRESLVQWQKEFKEAGRQIAPEINIPGRTVDVEAVQVAVHA
jgi:hypothetical protein